MSGPIGVSARRPVDTSAMLDRELLLLSGLETKVATGWCELILGSLDLMDHVRTEGSDAAKDWLSAVEDHVASMVAVEKASGDGCLLDLDHPTVRNFIGRKTMDGRPFISEEQIAAALRFQAAARTAA